MAVEVLSPQDCLKNPSSQGLLSLPMKHQQRNLNPNRAARPPPQPDRRKPQRKPARPNNSAPVQKPPVLLTGQVKILKRGEELPKPKVELSKPPSKENCSPQKVVPPSKENRSQKVVPDLGSEVRSGPDPKKTQVADQVNPALGFYAGGITSPPPCSLPLPKFSAKSTVVSNIDEAATSFFRNLLRIESDF